MRNCAAIFLLGIWLTIGAWFYVCKVKLLCTNSSNTPTKLEQIEDSILEHSPISPASLKNAYQEVFQVEEDMVFQHSQDQIETGTLFDTGIDGITTFLNQHPNTKLVITGYYGSEEQNPTTFDNLGLARADAILQEFVDKGISKEQIITIAQASNVLFSDTINSLNFIDFKFSERYEFLNESDIKDAYQALFFLEQHTHFFKEEEDVAFAEDPASSIEILQYYLNRNRSHSLLIDMPFAEEENYARDTLDIGLVRAFHLKEQLVDRALREETVLINSQLASSIFDPVGSSYPEIVQYNFIFPDAHDEALQKELALERVLSQSISVELAEVVQQEETTLSLKDATTTSKAATPSIEEPLLQFNSGSYTLHMNSTVVTYIEELKTHLSENPERRLLIIGHTDNVGGAEFNEELGRLRGYEARRLLINYHIPPTQIRVTSEGEHNPISDNQEDEGRRLNRRVDIDII